MTPRLIAQDATGLAGFVQRVFQADGDVRDDRPSELRVGDSRIMVSDGAGLRKPITSFLYVYVEDPDDTFARATGAGAEPVELPCDTPYGDRRATFEDPWGNLWQVARPAVA